MSDKQAKVYDFSIHESSNGKLFQVKLIPSQNTDQQTPFEESVSAAKKILRKLNNVTPVLLLEDDYESACTFHAFLATKCKFKVAMLRYQILTEDRKTEWVKKLCSEHNVEHVEYFFDFSNQSHLDEIDKVAEQLSCYDMAVLLKVWLICQFDDYPILPGKFTFPVFPCKGDMVDWNLPNLMDVKYFDFFNHFEGEPYFLGSTSELATSFLKTKTAQECISHYIKNEDFIAFDDRLKKILYSDAGFPALTEEPPSTGMNIYAKAVIKSNSIKLNSYLSDKSAKLKNEIVSIGKKQVVDFDLNILDEKTVSAETSKLIKNYSGAAFELTENAKDEASTKVFAVFPKLVICKNYLGDMDAVTNVISSLTYAPNAINLKSADANLHHNSKLRPLADFFKKSVVEYLNMCGYNFDDVEITQCWSNLTNKGKSHHMHEHPNSFISGVFYLTTGGGGNIIFHKKEYQFLRPAVEKETPWISHGLMMKPQKGMLIVFPSDLTHSTSANYSEHPRYSISFNTIIRGQVGVWENSAWIQL